MSIKFIFDLRILNYFTKLHEEAQKVGGAVYSIIGNHELMNVNGDMRYVSHEGIKGFDNYKKEDGNLNIYLEDNSHVSGNCSNQFGGVYKRGNGKWSNGNISIGQTSSVSLY